MLLVISVVVVASLAATLTDWDRLVSPPTTSPEYQLKKLSVVFEPASPALLKAIKSGETPSQTVMINLADRSRDRDADDIESQLTEGQRKTLAELALRQQALVAWFDLGNVRWSEIASPQLAFHHISGDFSLCLDDVCWNRLSWKDSYLTLPLIVNGHEPRRAIFVITPTGSAAQSPILSDAMGVSVRSTEEVSSLKRLFFVRSDYLRFSAAAVLLIVGIASIISYMASMPRSYVDVPTFGLTCVGSAIVLFVEMPIFYLSVKDRVIIDTIRLASKTPMYFGFCATIYTFFRLQRADVMNFSEKLAKVGFGFSGILTLSGILILLCAIGFAPAITGESGYDKIGSALMVCVSIVICSVFAVGGFVDLARERRRLERVKKSWFMPEISRRMGEGVLVVVSLSVMFYAYGLGQYRYSLKSGVDAFQAVGILPVFVLFIAQQHMIGRNTKKMQAVHEQRTPLEAEVATSHKAVFERPRSVTIYNTDFAGFTKLELTSVLKPNARAALFDFVVYLNAEVEAALESLRRFHIKDIADNLIQVFENPGGDGAQLRTIWDIHCKNIVPRIQQWRGELRKILMDQGVPGGYVEKICAKFDVHVLIFRADDFYVVRGMSRKSKGDMSCPTLSILKGIEKHTSGRHVGMLLRDAQLLGSVSLEAEESWKLKGGRKPKVLGIPKPAGSQLRARAVESKVTVDIEEFLEIEEVLMSFNELFERVGETVIVEIPSDAAGAEAVLKAS